eukprot:gb/GEZJ01008171.1/.p2 GENE.gb/GEZJ01008171.1/~~gb/GEZJ01008171.1/.p2  ORF type:complete len:106 (+),score=15.80 gb/GEZJ01008171.1/:248-565(+)
MANCSKSLLVVYRISKNPDETPSSSEKIETPPFPERIEVSQPGSSDALGVALAVIDAEEDGDIDGLAVTLMEAERVGVGVTDAEGDTPNTDTAFGDTCSSCVSSS